MAKEGLIHIYYGYGKGKTTAALGLALRASGSGLSVVFVQFLKNWRSGELAQLERLPGIRVFRGAATSGFARDMTIAEQEKTRQIHNENLQKALDLVQAGQCDLLVLDEVLDAWQLDLLDSELFCNLLANKPSGLELVITGHKVDDWLKEKADYLTEMVKHKHPFDQGIKGRRGIEF